MPVPPHSDGASSAGAAPAPEGGGEQRDIIAETKQVITEKVEKEAVPRIKRGLAKLTIAKRRVRNKWLELSTPARASILIGLGAVVALGASAYWKHLMTKILWPPIWMISPVDTLVYYFEGIMLLPILPKMAVIFLLALPLVLIGGVAYRWLTGLALGEALFKAYAVISNAPGVDVTADDTPGGVWVGNLLFLVGTLTFAVLFGIIVDEVSNKVEDLTQGNAPVIEQGHTVVLNWTPQTTQLLRQVETAKRELGRAVFREPIVILGNNKEEMDEHVKDFMEDARHSVRVITREGTPARIDDIRRVSAGHARNIIVMNDREVEYDADGPNGMSDDLQTLVATLINIKAVRPSYYKNSGQRQNVVVQLPGSFHKPPEAAPGSAGSIAVEEDSLAGRWLNMVSETGGRDSVEFLPFHGAERASKLLAQMTSSPGLSAVMEHVLIQEEGTAEFYVKEVPSIVGMSIGDARKTIPRGVVCGVLSPGSSKTRTRLQLNAPDSYVVQKGDKIVVFAENDQFFSPLQRVHERCDYLLSRIARSIRRPESTAAARVALLKSNMDQKAAEEIAVKQGKPKDSVKPTAGAVVGPQRVIMLGWQQDSSLTLQAMSEFLPEGSKVVIVHDGPLEPKPRARVGPLEVSHIRAPAVSPDTLAEAKLAEADSLVVALEAVTAAEDGGERCGQDEALLPLLVTVQDMRRKAVALHGRAAVKDLHLVAVIADEGTRDAAEFVAASGAENAPPLTMDLLQLDHMITGMITQVAAQPDVIHVYREILSADGNELFMKHPAVYNVPEGDGLTFGEMCDAAKRCGDTLLGILHADGTCLLPPYQHQVVDIGPDDKLVVLSDVIEAWVPPPADAAVSTKGKK
ncbi:unnamed protein product [Pedinophyceae sp. YPF-701]|nr:unnamed protein product [Pedinophyceae sp. YPF-701]